MKHYFAILWIAIRGEAGFCIIREAELLALRERVARYERRSAGQRQANKVRKAAVLVVGGPGSTGGGS